MTATGKAMCNTILVVDDEERIIDLARMYLEQDGFQVTSATNGNAAKRMILKDQPNLVVLDLMLPGMDGLEVCRRVREVSDVPIIMLTARSDDIDKIVGLELGADDYLTKPFNPRELVARIRAILRRADRSDARDEARAADQHRKLAHRRAAPAGGSRGPQRRPAHEGIRFIAEAGGEQGRRLQPGSAARSRLGL